MAMPRVYDLEQRIIELEKMLTTLTRLVRNILARQMGAAKDEVTRQKKITRKRPKKKTKRK